MEILESIPGPVLVADNQCMFFYARPFKEEKKTYV